MNTRLIVLIVVLVAIAGGLIAVFNRGHSDSGAPIVAITQIATHPALDEVRQGILDGLEARGYIDGENIAIVFRNANGDASLTVPIAQDFVRLDPAVIVPISTPSTIAVANATDTIPIIFSGVADPVGSRLVPSLTDPPGGNLSGVCDQWPFEQQVEAFFELFPNRTHIGMLFTNGDDVSRIGVNAMKRLSAKMGFELDLVPITSAADIYPSAVDILRDVDTIYTGIDHLILENMESLAKAADEAGKPLFGGESGSVEKGAVLALSINMTEFGDITAQMIQEVLEGASPGTLPVRVVSGGDLMINRLAGERFGLNIERLRNEGAIIVK